MPHSPFSLDIIITGGTMEKKYDPIAQTTVSTNDPSPLPDYFKHYIHPLFDLHYHPVCNMDSRDFTDNIRRKIANKIMTCGSHILITHGTDTMPETGEYLLGALPKDHGKTITLTGAMHPLAFHPSDAGFNLGYAIGQLRTLKTGIYICMNGQTFTAGEVKKNKGKGVFESL